MNTLFTDWILYGPSSGTHKDELSRLEKMHTQHIEQDHNGLRRRDPIDKAHSVCDLKHERRVAHHAHDFWNNPFKDHPEGVLTDEHLPQLACIVSDRQMAQEHCIRCSEIATLHDRME
jgi:hypothetical protein